MRRTEKNSQIKSPGRSMSRGEAARLRKVVQKREDRLASARLKLAAAEARITD
jgi:hypothetical protein